MREGETGKAECSGKKTRRSGKFYGNLSGQKFLVVSTTSCGPVTRAKFRPLLPNEFYLEKRDLNETEGRWGGEARKVRKKPEGFPAERKMRGIAERTEVFGNS